jgi:hypothetical protein
MRAPAWRACRHWRSPQRRNLGAGAARTSIGVRGNANAATIIIAIVPPQRGSGGTSALDRRLRQTQPGKLMMASEITDEALDFLLARAGLSLSAAQKAELKAVYPGIAAMAVRVRQPRGHMAEPALIYGFAEEDLP